MCAAQQGHVMSCHVKSSHIICLAYLKEITAPHVAMENFLYQVMPFGEMQHRASVSRRASKRLGARARYRNCGKQGVSTATPTLCLTVSLSKY